MAEGSSGSARVAYTIVAGPLSRAVAVMSSGVSGVKKASRVVGGRRTEPGASRSKGMGLARLGRTAAARKALTEACILV